MNEGVSCLCLTYGRPALLEEAVESFIRQRWDGPKELIVLNDHPEQQLLFEHGEVRVVNLGWRVPSLGGKRNLAVALAAYERLLVWDDDDIHLPWRIEETMKVLDRQSYFKCPEVWMMEGGELRGNFFDGDIYFHAACAYTKRLFDQVGWYGWYNCGEDHDFEYRLRSNETLSESCRVTRLPLERLYYIRRWGHGYYHASGGGDLSQLNPEVERGTYRLRPHWKTDYRKEVERRIPQPPETQTHPQEASTTGGL